MRTRTGPGPVASSPSTSSLSIIDNMLPDPLVGHAHGLGLRFVFKRELESIPTTDIGGRWVPTNFVRRGSGDTGSSRSASPAARRARRLRHVLQPRLGGPLALLDEARDVDVVVCAHVGFDGFEHVSDVWAGGLAGTTVRVRFWRFPAADVPRRGGADRLALRALADGRCRAHGGGGGAGVAGAGLARR